MDSQDDASVSRWAAGWTSASTSLLKECLLNRGPCPIGSVVAACSYCLVNIKIVKAILKVRKFCFVFN